MANNGQSEAGVRWRDSENYWIHTKLKADRIIPQVTNRGGSAPKRDELQGARYIRANFGDG